MCHVYHSRGTHRVGVSACDELLYDADGIDNGTRALEGGDETVCHAHLTREDDARCFGVEFAARAQELLIGCYRPESEILVGIGIIEQRRGGNLRVAGHGSEEFLAVDEAAHIAQQVAIVVAASGKILFHICRVDRVDRHYLVLRVGGCGGQHGCTPLGGLDKRLALFVGDTQSHAVDKHHVISAGLVEPVGRELGRVVVSL